MNPIDYMLTLETITCPQCEKICKPSAWRTLYTIRGFVPFCSVNCMKRFAKPYLYENEKSVV